MKKKALIFSGLVRVDKNMVGTAVIYKKIAELLLKQGYQVTIVVPEESDLQQKGIDFALYHEKNNNKLINNSSLVIFGAYPPVLPMLYAYLKKKTIVTYLWSLAPIGSLEFKDFNNLKEQARLHSYISASYNLSLLLSDKIFCRDEEVRKIILGSLISLGRVNLENYLKDKSFQQILEVAPFGIEKTIPKKSKTILRTKENAINKKDFVLLWNGGIWNWNDGETLIKVMAKLKKENIKLVFQGFKHPAKDSLLSEQANKTIALAKKLGLYNKNVIFLDKWVHYEDRASFLLESDVAVVSSPNIPEANFFLKTRIYDHLWSSLATILNDCEAFAPIIKSHNLGLVAKTGDVNSWLNCILSLKNDKKLVAEIRKNIKKYQSEISWSKSLKPLDKYFSSPYKTVDKNERVKELIKKQIESALEIINNF